jgi:hypothetical protein
VKRLVVALCVLCLGCEPELRGGFVVGKHHTPPSFTTVCTGRPVHCHPVIHPEHWSVVIATEGAQAEYSVSQPEWDRADMGEWWER